MAGRGGGYAPLGFGGVACWGAFQGPTAAIWWLWSLVRLWVIITNRHSVRTADLPR